MKLIIRKSECIKAHNNKLVKSPKEAIRRTLSNYLITDGVIIKVFQPSYVSRQELVMSDAAYNEVVTIPLETDRSFIKVSK